MNRYDEYQYVEICECYLCSIGFPHTTEYFTSSGSRIQKRCKMCCAEQKRDTRERIKERVLLHYSLGRVPTCQCCGEYDIDFLTLDHINRDGHEHRRLIKEEKGWTNTSVSGDKFYRYLLDAGYPEGLRTLCFNCNNANANGRNCPHEEARIQTGNGFAWFPYQYRDHDFVP